MGGRDRRDGVSPSGHDREIVDLSRERLGSILVKCIKETQQITLSTCLLTAECLCPYAWRGNPLSFSNNFLVESRSHKSFFLTDSHGPGRFPKMLFM